jgi:hypothetical protein
MGMLLLFLQILFLQMMAGGLYEDDQIRVQVPASWHMAVDGDGQGVILRKDGYILRLCTGCAQVSGIVGGRFNEIAGLVQPWYREDPVANPSACGRPEIGKTSPQIDRVDLWYRRGDAGGDGCREPSTTATVWYGSYFAERCPPAVSEGHDCGGFFLHNHWLTDGRADDPFDEMVFALTFDTSDPDGLPKKGDRELNEILRDASAIVASVHFKKKG